MRFKSILAGNLEVLHKTWALKNENSRILMGVDTNREEEAVQKGRRV